MDITKVDFEKVIKEAKESESGFNNLYCIIQPYVTFKAKTILDSAVDAEDIFQNVSLAIYRNIDNIDPKKFLGYLKTTVTNACNDVLRKKIKTTDDGYEIQTVEIDAYEDYKLPSEDIGVDLDAEYRSLVFKEVLNKIPEDYREVLVLRLVDELTFKEISNQLNIAESTVKYRFASSLKIAEQEILRIQKRDDIKIYSYSPLALFLLLFKQASENETVNTLLINKTVQYITNEMLNNVGNTVVNEVSNKILTSSLSKAGATSLTKTLATIGIVASLGVGSVFGYRYLSNNANSNNINEPSQIDSNSENIPTDETTNDSEDVVIENSLSSLGLAMKENGYTKFTVQYVNAPLDYDFNTGDMSDLPNNSLGRGYEIEFFDGLPEIIAFWDPIVNETIYQSFIKNSDDTIDLRITYEVPIDKGQRESHTYKTTLKLDSNTGEYVNENGTVYSLDKTMFCPMIYTDAFEYYYSLNQVWQDQPYNIVKDDNGRIISMNRYFDFDRRDTKVDIKYDDLGRMIEISQVEDYPGYHDTLIRKFAYREDGLCAGYVIYMYINGYTSDTALGLRYDYE